MRWRRTRDFSVDRWINAGCINMQFPDTWSKNQVFRSRNLVFRYRDQKAWFFTLKYLVFWSHRKTRFFYRNTRFFKSIWQMTSIKRSSILCVHKIFRKANIFYHLIPTLKCNLFQANVSILYNLKTPENQRF